MDIDGNRARDSVALVTRVLVVLVVAGIVAAGYASQAFAAKGDTVLVSRESGANGAAGTEESGNPSVSADGRYVAFESAAENLAGATFDVRNIYVRDTATGATTLASRANGAGGVGGDAYSVNASISADGRYVAFDSVADNLVVGEDEGVSNVFVRDLVGHTTTLVSQSSSGQEGDGPSAGPSISADGTKVAFDSRADNLVTGEDESVGNVFVRDLAAGTTVLVSRASGVGGAVADGESAGPQLSADGQHVAFVSAAGNLSDGDDDSVSDVFARDLAAGTTRLVSQTSGGVALDGDSYEPTVANGGQRVAFTTEATNLPFATSGFARVYLHDFDNGSTTLVSRASGAAGFASNGQSGPADISDAGDLVAFRSEADNLVAGPGKGAYARALFSARIYVRDLASDTTLVASRQSDADGGAIASGEAVDPGISGNGRYVAFASDADNLIPIPADTDNLPQIFEHDLLGDVSPPAGGGGSGEPGTSPVPPVGVSKTGCKSTLRVNGRRAKATKRGATILVQAKSPSGTSCRGKLRLTVRGKRIAQKTFTVAPGKTKRVKLRLNKRGRRTVGKHRRVRAVTRLTTLAEAGAARVATKRVVLRRR